MENLEKFVKAQTQDFETALSEIKSGRKRSHWMWYIFPQIKGLGFSETSKFYAIENLQQAKDFLKHPVLGKNLKEISSELLKLETNDAHQIFGSPDDLKLKSSMTLFDEASDETVNIFTKVLEKFFNGEKDQETLEILGK